MRILKKAALPLLAAGVCLSAAFLILLHSPKDMTGMAYTDIEAFRTRYPKRTVTYTVTIDDSLTLTESSTAAALTSPAQIDALADQKEYLQQLESITLGGLTLDPTAVARLQTAFPAADITDYAIDILGTAYPADTAHITLTALTHDTALQAAPLLAHLPKLETVTLEAANGPFSTETAAALAAVLPDLPVSMVFDLFGQTISTDMERVEYFRADIGDPGLDTIRSIMPLMDGLTYLMLDWCGTSDEATAALREELAPRTKVVWRVFMDQYNDALTDTMKIWAQFTIGSKQVECLKYCNEVRYIDVGHSHVATCEFVKYMPDLEVLIIADTPLADLEPLRTCENLTYLELFKTQVTDLSPLADLEQLEYLNLSDNMRLKDITPLYGLENLVKVNCTKAAVPQDQVDTFISLHPDTQCMFNVHIASTAANWRYAPDEDGYFRITPRYELLRLQIGYDSKDRSRYPTGHVTEEITYESTGITPE